MVSLKRCITHTILAINACIAITSLYCTLRLAGSMVAQYCGCHNTVVYNSQQELDNDLPSRVVRYGLETSDITARLTDTSDNPIGVADVKIIDEEPIEIRLDPYKGSNTRFNLDHELAHVYQDRQKKLNKSKSFIAFLEYCITCEPQANFFAAGWLEPNKMD